MIKSKPVKGVVYSLCKKEDSLSFVINVAETSVIMIVQIQQYLELGFQFRINEQESLHVIVFKSNSKTSGKPRLKPRMTGSCRISFAHLFANAITLI